MDTVAGRTKEVSISHRASSPLKKEHDCEDYPLHEGGADALVVHCSDPRFQEAFKLFLREELGLKEGEYDPLIVPGASQLLTFADSLPKFATGFLRPLKFLIKGHGLKRVVIIMHEDCAWYRDFVPQFVHMTGTVKEQQKKDLVTAKHAMQKEFPSIEVRMFYASITPQGRVEFSEVKEVR